MNYLCHKCQKHVDGLADDCLEDFLVNLCADLYDVQDLEEDFGEEEDENSQKPSTDVPKNTTSNSSGKQ